MPLRPLKPPVAGWLALTLATGATAFVLSRTVDLTLIPPREAPMPPPSWDLLTATLLLAVEAVTVLTATVAVALLRSRWVFSRYPAHLYSRPPVMIAHLFHTTGVVFGLLQASPGLRGEPVVASAILGVWAAMGLALLFPYLLWLIQPAEPGLLSDLAGELSRHLRSMGSGGSQALLQRRACLELVASMGEVGRRAAAREEVPALLAAIEELRKAGIQAIEEKDLSQKERHVADAAHFLELSATALETITLAGTWFELAVERQIRWIREAGQGRGLPVAAAAGRATVSLALAALAKNDLGALRLLLLLLCESAEQQIHRSGSEFSSLLVQLRRLADEGFQHSSALCESICRIYCSLAFHTSRRQMQTETHILFRELGDLIARAASREELAVRLLAAFRQLGKSMEIDPGRTLDWEKGLALLAASLLCQEAATTEVGQLVMDRLRRSNPGALLDELFFEVSSRGWQSSGPNAPRLLRDALLELKASLHEPPPNSEEVIAADESS